MKSLAANAREYYQEESVRSDVISSRSGSDAWSGLQFNK